MPTEDELAVADRVGTAVVRLFRLIERKHAQRQAAHPDALERATYYLLVHLVKGGPQRAVALAEAVRSDPSTISRQVAQLVRLGLVERTADPEDGRATLLVATAEGHRVFEENRRLRNEHIAALLATWAPADRETLGELLTRFVTDYESHLDVRPQPLARAASAARA
jgi:DNA-binding MarR family transcriptional regulator